MIKQIKVMTAKVKVQAQYFENYNVDADGFNNYGDKKPHWKPKGGQEFIFPVDSDWLMYVTSNIALISKHLLNCFYQLRTCNIH